MAVYLGSKLVLANGVGGTSLASGHAEAHAAAGGDPVSPASIGAAAAEHTHDGYMAKPTEIVVAIPKSGWTEYTYGSVQAVRVSGMRSTKLAILSAAPESWAAYTAANVHCAVQGYNALTFSADKTPTDDLNVNVVLWG